MGRRHPGPPPRHLLHEPARLGLLAERSKAGESNDARIINTTSPSGVYGNVGQTNYGAAKAGIAAFTIIAGMEVGRYGVTVNSISPAALTRMTENMGMGQRAAERPAEAFDALAADNIAPLVVWLGSPESKGVTGRVFTVARRPRQRARGLGRGSGGRQGGPLGPGGARRHRPRPGQRAAPNADMRGRRRHDRPPSRRLWPGAGTARVPVPPGVAYSHSMVPGGFEVMS